jgi:hypothetical protein
MGKAKNPTLQLRWVRFPDWPGLSNEPCMVASIVRMYLGVA